MANEKSFVLGKNSIPKWFNEEVKKGRAKIIIDEDNGEVEGVKIFYPTKTFNVNIGDKIMLIKSGLVVAPVEKTKEVKTDEDKKDSNGIQ